jgi:hypothetical protein
MLSKFLDKIITKLEKLPMSTKVLFIAASALIAVWLLCNKMNGNTPKIMENWSEDPIVVVGEPRFIGSQATGAWVPGAAYQDPGYGSGQGSIGPMKETFLAGCLGRDVEPKTYGSFPFVQYACRKEPLYNLPRDARLRHQAMYPARDHHDNTTMCAKHHPMDTIYSPPNEGL